MDGQGEDYEWFPGDLAEDANLMPSLEEVWREYLASNCELSLEAIEEKEAEVAAMIREIRHEHGFMVYADIYVLVPVCSACTYMAYRRADVPMPLPDVFGATWPRDYATLGMSIKEIRATRRGIKEGWQGVCCRTCGEILPLQRDVDFYIQWESLSQYFDAMISQSGSSQGRRIHKKLKQKVLQFWGNKCAGCHRTLEPHEVTMDHIIAFSQGGLTQLDNLQPLCHACNQAKADQLVDTVRIVWTFPLRPPPSNAFNVIW
jgi:hypothetical protein